VYELAQLNIATLLEPLDSPRLADFVANLDRINALADDAPGFVWRLQSDEGDATALRPMGDEIIVNMSTWHDVGALKAYVYGTAHVEIMRRRTEWFSRMRDAFLVLWWVPVGYRPTVTDAAERLAALRANGPAAYAFTFKELFPPPPA
jgi:Domain of unknown function (DUF3291)